jgi:tetratricopeptide (TPR) repeat protein
MEKYRVRLKSGRVVGPFIENQILEMRTKNLITGDEECQIFPVGDWLRIKDFEFWSKTNLESTAGEGTFVIDLTTLKKEKLSDDIKNQITIAQTQSLDRPIEEIDPEKFREFNYKTHEPAQAPRIESQKIEEIINIEVQENEDDVDKTLVRTIQKISTATHEQPKEDKTTITPDSIKWRKQLEDQKIRQEAFRRKFEEESRLLKEVQEKERVNYNEDATQVARLDEIRSLVAVEAEKSEEEFFEIEKIAEETKRENEKKKKNKDDDLSKKEEEEVNLEASAKRKKMIIVSLLALVLLAALFPDEEKKQKTDIIVPLDPIIEFPVPFNVKDPLKSEQLISAGKELLKEGIYYKKIEAALNYRKAYENDTDKRAPLSRLVRLYGELLPHSSRFERDGGVVFKLIQSNRLLQDVDPDVALGAGLFYRAIGKIDAGHEVIDRFVKSGSNNPTRELFAAYLISLSDKNIEKKADEVATSLLKTSERGVDVNLALIHYYRYKNYPEKGQKILEEALKEFPKSVPLIIAKGEYCFELLDMKCVVGVIKQIREQQAEKSKIYYGKMLEFEGFVLAAQNKTIEATKKFTESLKFNDSDLLRDRLINIKDIDSGANDEASKLIKQVQARELYKASVEAAKVFDFETALLKALSAYGLRSGYIKADLGLADIQMRLGMTREAMETLENLQKENPTEATVNFALLAGYIHNYKFNDAKKLFASLASTDLREDWRYSSLNARMFEKMGDLNQSILWLQKAINQNPLEDENLFSLAKLFTRAKRFSQAKNNLFKAMELNPTHTEYKIAYAAIIYEVDGADKAIDYLFGLLKQFPNNPSILGEIAIYYHRAGKNQQFLDTKKDIEALSVRDPRVYRFLVRSSMLDERWDDAVKYTNELIKLEPGELSAMMDIGKMLMQLKRYKDAATWFVKIRDKLPTYPRVGYFKALIELYVANPDQALIDVKDDMKMNGEYEDGVNLVGDILFKKEDFNGAEAEYKKCLRINTRSYGAIRGLADVAYKRGQFETALDLYNRALSEMRNFSDPDIHRKLGDVYDSLGRGSMAIESYQVYLKLVPEAPNRGAIEQKIRLLE